MDTKYVFFMLYTKQRFVCMGIEEHHIANIMIFALSSVIDLNTIPSGKKRCSHYIFPDESPSEMFDIQ